MRTTISLEASLYRAAKVLAETTGQTMSQVICDLMRKGLNAERSAIGEKDGLHVFSVPEDAPIIAGDRAAELMANEGVEDVA